MRSSSPWFEGIKKKKSRKYSPSVRQSRGRSAIREQRRLTPDKYKGESSRRVQVIPAPRSKGLRWWHPYLETTAARRGLRAARWNASWEGGGGGDPREKVKANRKNGKETLDHLFPFFFFLLFLAFSPEVVRTLAEHRSAQPGGACTSLLLLLR